RERRRWGDSVRTSVRFGLVGIAAAVGIGLLIAPATAKGGAIGGGGNEYFLNDSFTGTADTVFSYGDRGDDVHVGDWDGDGTDTLAVRRGGQYFLRNSLTSGRADAVFSYGDPGDIVLVGHWSPGQVGDTLGVRRGNTYFLRYSLTSGAADSVFTYGDPGDTAF